MNHNYYLKVCNFYWTFETLKILISLISFKQRKQLLKIKYEFYRFVLRDSFTKYLSFRNWVKHPLCWQFLQILQVIFGNYINQKIKDLSVIDTGRYIAFLHNLFYTWSVLLLESSVKAHALYVSSTIKISHALANRTGVSEEII